MTLVALCMATQLVSPQNVMEELTARDSIVVSSWTVGAGYNIVDDSATPFGRDFLDIKDTWHMVSYPATLSIGRTFKSGLTFEAIGSYNRYKTGKIVDGAVNTSPRNYYALDGKLNYDLNKLVGETAWFDPYISVGTGYSRIGGVGRATANAGFGFNTWFNDRWGLSFNTVGKWGIKEGSTKQLQHIASVVHRFGVVKELSKKGQQKLVLLEELEKEQQRVNDSIEVAKKEEERTRAIAANLEKEKIAAQLASLEKNKRDVENAKKQRIQEEVKNLGHVYFAFNSSYLSDDYKHLLDKLAVLMKNHPALTIKITSHADSRGAAAYNLWLSERRGKRAIDYLTGKGIDSGRLTAKAYGEDQLINECDDHVSCSEAQHKKNRRSEFLVDFVEDYDELAMKSGQGK